MSAEPRSSQPTAPRLCRPQLCAGSFYSFLPPVAESAKEDLPSEGQNGDAGRGGGALREALRTRSSGTRAANVGRSRGAGGRAVRC